MKLESDSKSLVKAERKTVKILSQARMEDKNGDPTRRLTRWNKNQDGIKGRERERTEENFLYNALREMRDIAEPRGLVIAASREV